MMTPKKKAEMASKIAALKAKKVATLIKSSYDSFKEAKELNETLNKRAELAVKFLSNKSSKDYTVDNLKKVYAKLESTIAETTASLNTIGNKLKVSYVCAIKSTNEKKANDASKSLVGKLTSEYYTVARHKADFSLLASKVAFDIKQAEGITDEEFLEVDENGYVEEPVEQINELEEFNKTFETSEDCKTESMDCPEGEKMDSSEGGEMEANEGGEMNANDESDESDEGDFNLNDESILDGLEQTVENLQEGIEEIENLEEKVEDAIDESGDDTEEFSSSSKQAQKSSKPEAQVKKASLSKFNSFEKSKGTTKFSNDDSLLTEYFSSRM